MMMLFLFWYHFFSTSVDKYQPLDPIRAVTIPSESGAVGCCAVDLAVCRHTRRATSVSCFVVNYAGFPECWLSRLSIYSSRTAEIWCGRRRLTGINGRHCSKAKWAPRWYCRELKKNKKKMEIQIESFSEDDKSAQGCFTTHGAAVFDAGFC